MRLFFLILLIISFSCSDKLTKPNKILFVTSNATHYGNSDIETTNNFPEIVYAYHEFDKATIEVDFVSPNGGQIPIGYIHSSDTIIQDYLFDTTLLNKLKNTLHPSEVVKEDYYAIYYVGGGSAMFGVAENKPIQKIAFYISEENDGLLTGICHGIAGMVNIKNSDGQFVMQNKKITGFPDAFENIEADYYKQFPFSIDQAVTDRGAYFEYSKKGWDGFYIVDNKIITGQDPTSAHLIAKEIIRKFTSSK
ncbi:type 1 glutamine amidotransferase domain-containing protein [Aquimarina litoralis]|uniref:type 1 glutamine amidotransferase domain-containing protein n=1 Tax=Aquimarina litoralis TaxID=584605 RepID=UPI001C59D460|nr:type 1 glutamine amidotransferase domain-containing protein [Aquimarina litoralis]MBW1296629.1 hypothetical protein [Aquimarina litoralis]